MANISFTFYSLSYGKVKARYITLPKLRITLLSLKNTRERLSSGASIHLGDPEYVCGSDGGRKEIGPRGKMHRKLVQPWLLRAHNTSSYHKPSYSFPLVNKGGLKYFCTLTIREVHAYTSTLIFVYILQKISSWCSHYNSNLLLYLFDNYHIACFKSEITVVRTLKYECIQKYKSEI